MVEMMKKYKIGKRRFGYINWVGAWTLYQKETLRFLNVWIQTIFSPLVSSLLFLLVLSLAIGNERGEILGVSFITFLAPGLIAMQVIQQSFSHSSSSFMIGKIQGNIVDLLYAPLSASEVTISISLAAVTRSFMIAIISILVFKLLIDTQVKHNDDVISYTTGTITGISVVQSGGSGYATSDTITIGAPNIGGNERATATVSVSAQGAVQGITVTKAGKGYTSAPAVTITSSGSLSLIHI